MFDDFFIRAMIAGIGVAIIAGPFGCFIIWRKMAYFGDTLSHAALLGVAMAFLLEINMVVGVLVVSVLVSLALFMLKKRTSLSSDALLGLLSHSSLALGLVVIMSLTSIRVDIMGLLFGDVLAVSKLDLLVIYLGGILVLSLLTLIWHPLFAATISPELAQAEGLAPDRVNLIFMLLMASVIAISMKIVGVLLITAMLIIPAATARRLSTNPETMTLIAASLGIISVVLGLFGSLEWNTPSGPSIIVASMVLFIISMTPVAKYVVRRHNHNTKQETTRDKG